jgi:nicotinate-nucleotide adenylyltransferase
MRLGILGGTFDPVHYGHLLLAESCREQCRLDEVWLMPAAAPPHKLQRAMTAAKKRMEMLELAVAGHDALRASAAEVERGGVSFTIDTLASIREQQPSAELFLLMGADTLLDLPAWRSPEGICQLAAPVVARRCGAPEPDLSLLSNLLPPAIVDGIRGRFVEMPLIGLNSSDIRRRVASGRSIRFMTPRAVEKYIETERLYRDESPRVG